MASKKLGEAYLELKIKDKLKSEMAKAKASVQKELDKASMAASRINIRNQRKAIAEGERLQKAATARRMRFDSAIAKHNSKVRSELDKASTAASRINIKNQRATSQELERASASAAKLNIRRQRDAVRASEAAAKESAKRQAAINTRLAQRSRINRARTDRHVEEQNARRSAYFSAVARRRIVNRERSERQASVLAKSAMDASRIEIRRRRMVARAVAIDARRQAVRQRQMVGHAGVAAAGIGAASTAVLARTLHSTADAMQELFMRGLEVNTTLDRQRIVLEQLTGSARVAGNMLKELIDFDVKTPFNIQDLSSAARMLKATGVVGDREVIPMVRKLADAAAGSGGGPAAIEHIALAISQMLSKGKIQSEEMTRQLSNAGIPAWKLLADAMGKTVGEVQELSKEGKLGLTEINLLIDAMGKKYKGLAEKIGLGTIGDAFEVARSKFDLLLAEMTKPFKAPFIETMQSLVNMMESDFAKNIVSGIGGISSMLGKALQFFTTNPFGQFIVAFGAVATAAMLVATAIGGIVGGIVALGVAAPAALIPLAAVAGLVLPMTTLAAAVTAVGASFMAAFNHKDAAQFRATLGDIYSRVKDIGAEIAGGLMEALTAAFNVLGGLFGKTNLSVWEAMAEVVKSMVTELLVWAKVFKEVMSVMRQQSEKTPAMGTGIAGIITEPTKQVARRIRGAIADPFGLASEARKSIEASDALRNSHQKLADAEERRLKGLENYTNAQEDAMNALRGIIKSATSINLISIRDSIIKRAGGPNGAAGKVFGVLGDKIAIAQQVADARKSKANDAIRESMEKEADLQDRAASLRKKAPAAIRKALTFAKTFQMADQFEAGRNALFGGIGKATAMLPNAAVGAGKGVAGLAAGMFGGESQKPRSGFTGIADLSRQIQESILSSDERKDRKAMVKGINAIDAGVKGVKNVIEGATKWIGKAL